MSAVSEDMLIDVVNDSDTPVGKLKRRDVFTVHANFRVAHVLVFNFQRELLIQRLALTRHRHPGYWGSSVAGYLHADEDYETAAIRRVREELGAVNPRLEPLGKIDMYDQGCHKFIGIFEAIENGPFTYDGVHIDRLEFLPVSAIQILVSSGARLFTPTFLRVFDFYQRLQLKT
jgi:8-oxo-dGTP pyrophosphatase MutT (NUDIX family)